MDYLHPEMDDRTVARMTSLALAHVGDAVYELIARSFLSIHGTQTAHRLHDRTIKLVCAPVQAKAARQILPLLTEEERQIFQRARNVKPKNVPQAATVGEYAHATALEALLGFLYLRRQYDRINILFDTIQAAWQIEDLSNEPII